MKSFLANYKLPALVATLLLFVGCKQPETIVVDESPTAVAPSDTVSDKTSSNEASFRKLVVGEYNKIMTLDPLFAENASTMRAVQLLYEGLVRLDASGSVIPGMAKNWEVSSDSLEYTFHLQSDIFYHDSDIFSAGTGRRMTSGDVKFIFERMAQAGVPPRAAHLFMDIKDFEPYYQEQRKVYNPANRKLDGVSGIQTPNDTTVVFELINQDPRFLKKLATPLAVIYPQESVGQSVDSFSPVGTGPFQFSSRQPDSTLIFSKFQDYYSASNIDLNRVDMIANSSESKLFRAMSAGDIHMMPQLGPHQLQSLIDSDGKLLPSYSERYNLQKTNGKTEFVLRYNPNANLTATDAETIAQFTNPDSSNYFDKFPDQLVTRASTTDTSVDSSNVSNLKSQIYATFSEDPFVRTYLGHLSKKLLPMKVQLQMVQIRAPSRNTGLFFTQNYPLIPDNQWESYKELFRFQVRQVALYRSEISGLDFNAYPWWFDLRNVTLPAVENLN